jgi:uroporphyrinogen decarboxylase
VKSALLHEEVDRPPQDLGSTCNTSITKIAYIHLLRHLGLHVDREATFLSKAMQVVEMDEAVLRKLHIDTRGLHSNPPDADMSAFISPDSYVDEWGVRYRAARSGNEILYFDAVESPLAAAASCGEIERYRWPDPRDPGRTRGLREKAIAMRDGTECAIVGHMGDTSIFQACTSLRGMERFLLDLAADAKMAQALMEMVLEVQLVKMERYLDEVGEYIDVVCIGDDFAGQQAPLISPALFRAMIKPYLKRYCELIKRKTSAPLHLHSCGAVRDLLSDLIDIGVDIINPVQVSAAGMDPAVLKKKFGKSLSFWGGIDTQRILPYGTPEDVRNEVTRISRILGKGGGYVLNPVHNVQPDVPPQNILAMYETFFQN